MLLGMAVRRALRALSGVLIVLWFWCPADAAEWYLSAPSDCSGTEPVMAAFVALLPTSIAVHASSANAYAETSIAQINSIAGSGSESIIDSLALNKSKAADYKRAIVLVGSGYKVPYFVDVTAAIYAGMVFSPAAGTGLGLLFTYILDKLKEPAAEMTGFALFIAEGGRLERRWKLLKDMNQGFNLVSSLEYAVALGSETRRFVTAGCSYPVKVNVKEFRTNERVGNKIVKPNGANWGVFDIEDNKWDSTVLQFTGQDQQYYYFNEDQVENGTVVGQNIHRINFQGGRWQFKHYDEANFKNFSGPISAF
jgi:hypothetical protein